MRDGEGWSLRGGGEVFEVGSGLYEAGTTGCEWRWKAGEAGCGSLGA